MSQTEKRLVELHQLRDKIDLEISALERAIVRAQHARVQAVEQGARIRRTRRQAVAQCGTPSGYYRHRRTLREPACEECKIAHRVAEAMRVQKRRKQEAPE